MSDKLVIRLVTAVTILIPVAVLLLNRRVIPAPEQIPSFAYFLPKLNAIINGTCTVLLLTSFYFIRKLNIQMHKRLNLTAFFLSALFLISYVTYHYLVPETKYGGEGTMKTVYYAILISHIILAAVVLPLILLSFHRGLQMDVARHKKLVRWSFPIWLYVTTTGVIVYLMISPYYNFPQ